VVSAYYDPLLAKVITWGDDRQESIRKMIRALQDTVILGVTTNIPYLLDILQHHDFSIGSISTNFLRDKLTPWKPGADTSNSTWLALAAHEIIRINTRGEASRGKEPETDQLEPWAGIEGWRNLSE
jgi:acetyl/propionyl-CoA carboxylase alpha subunit